MKIMLTRKNGFTLIELLISIAIIGILAGVILVSTSNSRTKANIAKAKSDMNQISKAIQAGQIQTGAVLLQMTASNCSDCPCRPSGTPGSTRVSATNDLRNVPVTDECYVKWVNSLTGIQNVAGLANLANDFARDPWGSPYLLDENERENAMTPCIKDRIKSPGPDGTYSTDADNIIVYVPFIYCLN